MAVRTGVILETLGGETLSHLLDRLDRAGRRLPVADAVVLGQQLCSAMHYLHANGLLHLDLKPSNIIAEAGRAKVLDLSIAMPPGPGRRGRGTFEFMAPEQARGGEVSAAADVFGIGMVLFDALTGRSPWEPDDDDASRAGTAEDGADEASSIELYDYRGGYAQLEGRAPPVGRYRRLPRALSSLIDGCLEPESAARPTLQQLSDGLAALATGQPSVRRTVLASRPEGTPAPSTGWCGR